MDQMVLASAVEAQELRELSERTDRNMQRRERDVLAGELRGMQRARRQERRKKAKQRERVLHFSFGIVTGLVAVLGYALAGDFAVPLLIAVLAGTCLGRLV